jgi:hypothetical protein
MTADRPPGILEVHRSGVRLAAGATSLVTGGGMVTGIAWALDDHPVLLLTALTVAGVTVLILAVALLGRDEERSQFDRLMSFAGLLLHRAPANYILPSATYAQHPQPPATDTRFDMRASSSQAAQDQGPPSRDAAVSASK